jgi:serine/threonine protein kinase
VNSALGRGEGSAGRGWRGARQSLRRRVCERERESARESVSRAQLSAVCFMNIMNEEVEAHILRRFEIVHKMGAGAYGHVWRVKEKRSGKYFALKKIFEAFRHSTDAKRTYREIAVLRQLSHRNVLRLECVERASNDSDLYLVC